MLPKNPLVSVQQSWNKFKSCHRYRVPSECTICLSSISNPAKLTCGHLFCEGCLGEYWHVQDKMNHIVCPLCRAHVTNISFNQEDESSSMLDFRQTFDPNNKQPRSDLSYNSDLCLKISLVIPIIYYAVKLLRVPFLSFMSYLQHSVMSTKFYLQIRLNL